MLSRLVTMWAWGSASLTLGVLVVAASLLFVRLDLEALPAMAELLLSSVALSAAAVLSALPVALAIALALDRHARRAWHQSAGQRWLSAFRDIPPLLIGVIGWMLGARGLFGAWIVLSIIALPVLAHGLRGAFGRARSRERLSAIALGASTLQVLFYVVGPSSSADFFAVLLRALARVLGVVAPLLLLGALSSLALEVFHEAAAGRMGFAVAGATLLVLSVLVLHGVAAYLERNVQLTGAT
ncbi:MAG: hypothetical protein EA397_06420 [Deltaproteobacteria bacterium]|nr:MAG: hypothetical protein EA397_06420 [Deltaproteobacteria bacterium]